LFDEKVKIPTSENSGVGIFYKKDEHIRRRESEEFFSLCVS